MEEKKIRYSFMTNAAIAGATEQWRFLASGLGSRHFYTIMEGLGRATYDHAESCATLFNRAKRKTEHSQAFIVITPRQNHSLQTMIKHLEIASGSSVYLLTAMTDS
jgi:hypothetical protein